ncbi:MBL fold metallo-hydrolase [Micromonospora sp. CA-240977]|uniref:MBL fold metallo-hydrolase n=1 Tax=Micromonospora sp. CA-240977 TaxID=3239957 RepID=UPI003D93DD7D
MNGSDTASLGPKYRIGRIEARRIVEWNAHLFTRDQVFPDSSRQEWLAQRSWLEPRFWNAENDAVTLTIQSFLLESDGKLVLVDTGIGNGKKRPTAPPFENLSTSFLERLREAGAAPEDIDTVVLTHLHSDHVGWNTRLDGEVWVPTFPNARYLISQAEFDYWNPEGSRAAGNPDADQALVFADSIAPILASNQVELWTGSFSIAAGLDLEQVPGHTPGSAVLKARSEQDSAVFVGDLLSTPMMLSQPDLCAKYGDHWIDDDPDRVRAARRDLLTRAAHAHTRVVPAHVNADAGVFVTPASHGFTASDGMAA